MRRSSRALVAVLVGGATIVGCAVGPESSPRPIAGDPIADGASSVGPASESSGVGRVYLQSSDASGTASLVSVQRDSTLDPAVAVAALLDGPTEDEQGAGVRSAIPRDTRANSVRFTSSGTVQVDVNATIFDATGDDLVNAIAQIVLTLCEIQGVEQVNVTVDGQATEWPRGDGTLTARPLTAFDFPGRAVSSQPDYPSIIDEPTD
ncbi:MAG: GerMN domain-containing protein [Actinomycetota bacterium]